MFKENCLEIYREFHSYTERKNLSPATFAHVSVTVPALREHLSGKFLDIGCGEMPFRSLIEEYVLQYDAIDLEKRVPDVRYVGSVQDMNMIADSTYDSAMCLEVLEHVPNPFRAVSEINRILKKGGKLVCSVPHLSRLHEAPQDYFRYTKYGLRSLFENAGFKVISVRSRGGLFSFLGHQVSTLFLCLLWRVPLVKNIAIFLNKYVIVRGAYFLDTIFDKQKIFALGYTAVFEKVL